MKFNRSQIMKAAWAKYRRFTLTFAQALRLAWYEARNEMPVHQVWGDAFCLDAPVMIAGGLTFDEAGRIEWLNKCRYDHVWITATGSVGRPPQSKGSGMQAA